MSKQTEKIQHHLSLLFGARKWRPEIRSWDAFSEGFLEGKVASRNTPLPYSCLVLSWAQGGPAQEKFKHPLSSLSGARKYSWSRDAGGRRLESTKICPCRRCLMFQTLPGGRRLESTSICSCRRCLMIQTTTVGPLWGWQPELKPWRVWRALKSVPAVAVS